MTTIEQAERHYLSAIKAIYQFRELMNDMTRDEMEKCRYSMPSVEANAHWAQRDFMDRLEMLENMQEAAE